MAKWLKKGKSKIEIQEADSKVRLTVEKILSASPLNAKIIAAAIAEKITNPIILKKASSANLGLFDEVICFELVELISLL